MHFYSYHTLVLGSGAAGLAAAVRFRAEGVESVALLTEGLDQGTSINAGSDKQTYYKPSLCGATPDSPRSVAESYLLAGGADGDLALTEAATATRAFFHLVDLGVPFPRDAYGQYAGYRTDHDPARRATSCGPYTSREMCRALIREVKRRDIPVLEDRVAVRLLSVPREIASEDVPQKKKILGVVCVNRNTLEYEVYRAENVVFAVGGPGGLYKRSVYPEVHTGAIGLALEVGALAKGLPESQFGLASFTTLEGRTFPKKSGVATPKEFRWNVSGSFMQVIPRFVSTATDGESDAREFLTEYFASPVETLGRVFLKGYQWPFDARKISGSSLIDLCVFHETAIRGRRVFLDFRVNPSGYAFDALPSEAREYLVKSGAEASTPFERLMRMNPGAVELYRDWGVDLSREPLEIAVCAQHNNGGLAVDVDWRSLNVEGLYPIGEVAGTHGVARPGGSALNAGQVGAFRAAERIAHDAGSGAVAPEIDEAFSNMASAEVARLRQTAKRALEHGLDWREERDAFQTRMSVSCGILRDATTLERAKEDANAQLARLYGLGSESVQIESDDAAPATRDEIETLRNLQLCLAHKVYLDSIYENAIAGVGSRGSQVTLDPDGTSISDVFPSNWRARPEDASFRSRVFYSYLASNPGADGSFATRSFWRDAKPIPEPDEWFENVWRDYREGKIYERSASR